MLGWIINFRMKAGFVGETLCYLTQESDGTSRFTLEDGSGSLALESCDVGAAARRIFNPLLASVGRLMGRV